MINAERVARDVIVIGGSAGALLPLLRLLEGLPRSLPATIAVVLHRSPFHETRLPWVLGRRTRLMVAEASDGDPLGHGMVYVAPRDQHMLVENGVLRLDRGAKEHRTRPAIDPLFRTAASVYGNRVVGVLLSGMGADGVSGLLHIKASEGLSLVQSPAEAEFSVMPMRAINEDDVDAVLRIEALPDVLLALATGDAFEDGHVQPPARS
jgi:two-component system, chemotaxis family, protein-glutamate methylesterase/glutaminase